MKLTKDIKIITKINNYYSDGSYELEGGSITTLRSSSNCTWLKFHIYKGFQWDGCTLAPDFSSTYQGCLVHDFLYTNLEHHNMIFNRLLCDKIFANLLKSGHFPFWRIYYWVVVLFGGIYHNMKKKKWD